MEVSFLYLLFKEDLLAYTLKYEIVPLYCSSANCQMSVKEDVSGNIISECRNLNKA